MFKTIFRAVFNEKIRIDIWYIYFKIRGFFYQGKRVSCNCCDRTFRKFLPYGNPARQNAACPYCNSLERNRLLLHYLFNEEKIQYSHIKLLHFAPERAIEKKIKALKTIDYTCADINPALADYVVDITSIPFEDNTFDLTICSHVLAHVKDEKKALKEIKRTLKPDGIAIIMTRIFPQHDATYELENTNTPEDRMNAYGYDDIHRMHGKDFEKRLKDANFDVRTIDYRNKFTESERLKFGLGNGEREILFICKD